MKINAPLRVKTTIPQHQIINYFFYLLDVVHALGVLGEEGFSEGSHNVIVVATDLSRTHRGLQESGRGSVC